MNKTFWKIMLAAMLAFCFISFMQNIQYNSVHNDKQQKLSEEVVAELNDVAEQYCDDNDIVLVNETFIPQQSVESKDKVSYKMNCATKNVGVITLEITSDGGKYIVKQL